MGRHNSSCANKLISETCSHIHKMRSSLGMHHLTCPRIARTNQMPNSDDISSPPTTKATTIYALMHRALCKQSRDKHVSLFVSGDHKISERNPQRCKCIWVILFYESLHNIRKILLLFKLVSLGSSRNPNISNWATSNILSHYFNVMMTFYSILNSNTRKLANKAISCLK